MPEIITLAKEVRLFVLAVLYFEWWGVGMVICLERGADLHMTQLS